MSKHHHAIDTGAQRVMIATLRAWIGFRLNPNGIYRFIHRGVSCSSLLVPQRHTEVGSSDDLWESGMDGILNSKTAQWALSRVDVGIRLIHDRSTKGFFCGEIRSFFVSATDNRNRVSRSTKLRIPGFCSCGPLPDARRVKFGPLPDTTEKGILDFVLAALTPENSSPITGDFDDGNSSAMPRLRARLSTFGSLSPLWETEPFSECDCS